jgi:hypothetical protein
MTGSAESVKEIEALERSSELQPDPDNQPATIKDAFCRTFSASRCFSEHT